MNTTIRICTFLCLCLLLATAVNGQNEYYRTSQGDFSNRKVNVHSGNQVRTTFFNYGLVGRINAAQDYGGEWPINSGHFYVGDISVMVGAEIELPDGRIITPVTVSDGPRGSNEEDPTDPTIKWTWEPLAGFDNPDTNTVAMSQQPNSWPASWPDRLGDANDPGWPGQWNGFFGKDQFNADQESYWVMDDSQDKEWIQPPYNFFPDANDTTRGGLALLSNVRGLQWSQTLAQNTIFWLYDVTNIGTTDYDKAVFGMIVGTTIGGDGDTDDDNSRFDAEADLTYSWDFDDVGNTGFDPGYMGYAFLESPGNRNNGIDDDNDEPAIASEITVDVFSPRQINAGDDLVLIDYEDAFYARTVETLTGSGLTLTVGDTTFNIQPGDVLTEVPFNNIDDNFNGLIDEYTEIPDNGIDDDRNGLVDEENPQIGLGYINYLSGESRGSYTLIDEGRDDGIDNDGDWNPAIDDVGLDGKPDTNDEGEGDGLPTSGFRIVNGRPVDTGLPGEPNIDKTDIDESDQIGLTSFYFFTPFNLVRLRNDNQLWTILEPGNFNDAVQNVDGDFIYGTGYFPLAAGQTERISLAFFFGDNLQDIFRTKETVQLIYDNDYNFAKAPLLPTLRAFAGDQTVTLYWDTKSEESFDQLSQVVTGDPFDFEGYKIYRATFPSWDETGVVTNVFGSRVADVPIAQFDIVNSDSGFFPSVDPGTGSVFYLGDNTGLVHTFTDTTVDNGFTYFYAVTAYDRGINTADQQLQPAETSKFAAITQGGEIELGSNVVAVRPEAPAAGTIPAQARPLERLAGDGPGRILAQVIDPIRVVDGAEYELTFADSGFIASPVSFTVINLTTGDTVVNASRDLDIDATTFEGVKLFIDNGGVKRGADYQATPLGAQVGWLDTTANILPIPTWNLFSSSFTTGRRYPANYQVEVGTFDDAATSDSTLGVFPFPKQPTNFRIKNVSENRYVGFDMRERSQSGGTEPVEERGYLDARDQVVLYEPDGATNVVTWTFTMGADTSARLPQAGDVATLPIDKPFLSYDVFRFQVDAAREDKALAASQLDEIKVVPNPYIATALWEPRNNFNSGRGDREIHFINLPKECTIRIFTLKGDLVATIEHSSHETNGTADWNLLSLDQLDVAYGVYIYHVDAPGVGETIGKFAVIK